MLSQHADILSRLRGEIIPKVGLSRRPTHEDLKDMKYLRAFINGMQRMIVPEVCTDLESWYQRSSDYIHPCTHLFSQRND